jgi:hypothetical protein
MSIVFIQTSESLGGVRLHGAPPDPTLEVDVPKAPWRGAIGEDLTNVFMAVSPNRKKW